MSEAAIAKWPGNEMPNFKKDSAAKEELDKLVAEIAPTCSYEPAGFEKESIRQHILDVINERRRHRNGYDYTQVIVEFSVIFFITGMLLSSNSTVDKFSLYNVCSLTSLQLYIICIYSLPRWTKENSKENGQKVKKQIVLLAVIPQLAAIL